MAEKQTCNLPALHQPSIAKTGIILALLLVASLGCIAQSAVHALQFSDADTRKPLSFVTITTLDDSLLLVSDAKGIAKVPDSLWLGLPVIGQAPGYMNDTFRITGGDTLRRKLYQLSELDEVIVSSKSVQRVFRSSRDQVIDYSFDGERIIILSYTGILGGNAHLTLVDGASGDVISTCPVVEVPRMLFQSCLGGQYMLGYDGFRRIVTTEKEIKMGEWAPMHKLYGLFNCRFVANNDFFFRIFDSKLFGVKFGHAQSNDTALKYFYKTGDNSSALVSSSAEAMAEYYTALERNYEAEKTLRDRAWLLGPYHAIQMKNDIFLKDDSIVIFDFNRMQIHLFNSTSATPGRYVPIRFSMKGIDRINVLQDPITKRLFLNRPVSRSRQSIQEIDIVSGTLIGQPMVLEREWASKLKVYGSRLYFLQKPHGDGSYMGSVRQLWVQRGRI